MLCYAGGETASRDEDVGSYHVNSFLQIVLDPFLDRPTVVFCVFVNLGGEELH